MGQIQSWLASHSSDATDPVTKGTIHEFTITFPEGPVEIMIHERVAGKAWGSLWFKSNNTPWEKDLDCAHAAAAEMSTQVRCIASGWSEGDDPDEYWKVENGQQEQIQWRC